MALKEHTKTENISAPSGKETPILAGVFFTLIIAVLGYGLAYLPGFNIIGPMATSILLAVIYRHFFGYPVHLKKGIQFTAKILLRVAIIFYGLKLNMLLIFQEGTTLLLKGVLVIVFSITIMLLLAKLFKADHDLSVLIGIGTGVCGAAAIAAVSPILKSRDEDTAMSVGIIALIGTIFSIGYTFMRNFIRLSEIDYGIWSGVSLHELAHVALAAAPAGEEALAMALLAKLGRVFLLIPLCFILMFWMKHKTSNKIKTKVPFPCFFLIGFLAMSFLNSFIINNVIHLPKEVLDGVSLLSTFLLTMAMVGLGVNIDLRELHVKALRPLIAVMITSYLLSVLTFFIV
ncbi:putative sulfate exporter family transporter [Bacillus aquiflavi]|uniref:YeiH family protein n=1 Tax=Bacillus aquiflavi TaxID=2672567 RepID=UPI001CA82D59|nr:putative sulfate exporter family transporter [Bacillus aquiflavi]UAC47991.1 putative sulfate exporter family transporter [Bacillus aquiflavi]